MLGHPRRLPFLKLADDAPALQRLLVGFRERQTTNGRRLSYYLFSFAVSAEGREALSLRAEANLIRPSRICARDQAANPKVSAGSSSAFMKHEDSGDGLIPISAQTRVMNGRSVLRRNHATKCKPASGTSRIK